MMFDLENLKKVFNEICRALIVNNEARLRVIDVQEMMPWGPQDPLSIQVLVAFEETVEPGFGYYRPGKNFRMVFDSRTLHSILADELTGPKILYDTVLQQYKSFHYSQGPGEDDEADLTRFYQDFEERGNTYNNVVRIFFSACKMVQKYKHITLIPRSFETRPDLKWDGNIDTLGQPGNLTMVRAFTTDVLSNIAAGQNFPPTTEFKIRLTDFDPTPKDEDPEAIKPLVGKADGITYAAARVMCKICQQLKNPRFVF